MPTVPSGKYPLPDAPGSGPTSAGAGDPRRLREIYGRPVNEPHGHPIAELIKTVLSQHTNDRNRDRAFARAARALPHLGGGARRALDELEDAIRPGGLARQKAPRIQAILERLGDPPDLDWTETAPREESLEFLSRCPASGAKPPPAS